MSLVLVLWAVVEITVVVPLIRDKAFGLPDLSAFLWPATIIWTLTGFFGLYYLAWVLLGKEVITVTSQSISINRFIDGFAIPFGFPKEYSAKQIKDLRISSWMSDPVQNLSVRWVRFWRMGGGFIAFGYGEQTIRCGDGINETEAKQILAEIQQRYPHYSSRLWQV